MSAEFDSGAFKAYKRHKNYKQKIDEQERKRIIVEKQYLTCMNCGKINVIDDIKNEESENRTMRAHYTTWKKLKDLANQKGGYMENAILYLLHLHEERMESGDRNDYEVGIAGFGGDDNKKK